MPGVVSSLFFLHLDTSLTSRKAVKLGWRQLLFVDPCTSAGVAGRVPAHRQSGNRGAPDVERCLSRPSEIDLVLVNQLVLVWHPIAAVLGRDACA